MEQNTYQSPAPANVLSWEHTQDLIIVEQLPVITEKLATKKQEVLDRVNTTLTLVCTDETIKTVKKERATLNKELGLFEDVRKQVKAAVNTPYARFEDTYKDCIANPYKEADAQLKRRIDDLENERKDQKRNELRDYFNECREACGVDIMAFETWNPNVTLSESLKSLKESARTYINRICDELTAIETMDHNAEVLVEYRRCLNVAQAVAVVNTRHKAIEEQQRRQEEQSARRQAEQEAINKVDAVLPQSVPAPLAPPVEVPSCVVDDDPVTTVNLGKVTHKLSKLRILKKYLDEGGYRYE